MCPTVDWVHDDRIPDDHKYIYTCLSGEPCCQYGFIQFIYAFRLPQAFQSFRPQPSFYLFICYFFFILDAMKLQSRQTARQQNKKLIRRKVFQPDMGYTNHSIFLRWLFFAVVASIRQCDRRLQRIAEACILPSRLGLLTFIIASGFWIWSGPLLLRTEVRNCETNLQGSS